jgi:hypothetical protein
MMEESDALAQLDEGAKLGWKAASDLIKPFGPVAANFAEATRMLVGSYMRGETSASSAGQNHLLRLIKNDTLKATYYYFSKQFRPELLKEKSQITERDFIQAYTTIDHAAVLTFCYLFKNLSKKIEKEEWEYVQVPLYEALAIGGAVGQAIKQIGLGIGLLIRGVRYLSFAPFMRENRKAFKEYRHHLKANDIPFDTAFEEKMWQCSSIQIGGLLLERMGFPRTVTLQFVAAAERSETVEAEPIFGTPFRMAECLVDAYMEGHEIPTSTPAWVGKELQLPAEVRGTLLAALNKVFDDKNRIEWLNKTSNNLSPETTPELAISASDMA